MRGTGVGLAATRSPLCHPLPCHLCGLPPPSPHLRRPAPRPWRRPPGRSAAWPTPSTGWPAPAASCGPPPRPPPAHRLTGVRALRELPRLGFPLCFTARWGRRCALPRLGHLLTHTFSPLAEPTTPNPSLPHLCDGLHHARPGVVVHGGDGPQQVGQLLRPGGGRQNIRWWGKGCCQVWRPPPPLHTEQLKEQDARARPPPPPPLARRARAPAA